MTNDDKWRMIKTCPRAICHFSLVICHFSFWRSGGTSCTTRKSRRQRITFRKRSSPTKTWKNSWIPPMNGSARVPVSGSVTWSKRASPPPIWRRKRAEGCSSGVVFRLWRLTASLSRQSRRTCSSLPPPAFSRKKSGRGTHGALISRAPAQALFTPWQRPFSLCTRERIGKCW